MGPEPNSQIRHTLSSLDRDNLVRFASRIVGHNDAEDVVQSALLKAHQCVDSFQGKSKLQTWVYTIVRNCALDHLRRQKLRPEHSIPETLELTYAQDEAQSRLLSEHRTVVRCLEQLTPHHREAVLAVAAHDTYPEAAAALGIKPQTLKSRFLRAKRRLEQIVATT